MRPLKSWPDGSPSSKVPVRPQRCNKEYGLDSLLGWSLCFTGLREGAQLPARPGPRTRARPPGHSQGRLGPLRAALHGTRALPQPQAPSPAGGRSSGQGRAAAAPGRAPGDTHPATGTSTGPPPGTPGPAAAAGLRESQGPLGTAPAAPPAALGGGREGEVSKALAVPSHSALLGPRLCRRRKGQRWEGTADGRKEFPQTCARGFYCFNNSSPPKAPCLGGVALDGGSGTSFTLGKEQDMSRKNPQQIRFHSRQWLGEKKQDPK